MIIGINGRIGSGKDLVGKIIQYLIWKSKVERREKPLSTYSLNDFLNKNYDLKGNLSEWQIKKFADKLKNIVCLLIGCRREQLEDINFKNQELEEGWWYYKFKDAKSKVGYMTTEQYNYLNKNQKDWWELVKLTPRKLLQLLGTECGRNIIHPNIWINTLFSDYKNFPYQILTDGGQDTAYIDKYPNWIITDTRFPNEANAIKEKDGIVIRVEREEYNPKCSICGVEASKHLAKHGFIKEQLHESETALDNYPFDYIINNNSDIEHLIEEVRQFLIKEKIL